MMKSQILNTKCEKFFNYQNLWDVAKVELSGNFIALSAYI